MKMTNSNVTYFMVEHHVPSLAPLPARPRVKFRSTGRFRNLVRGFTPRLMSAACKRAPNLGPHTELSLTLEIAWPALVILTEVTEPHL